MFFWTAFVWLVWQLARGLVYAPGLTIGTDGWTDPGETWTYGSATTFTVPGDQTAKYTKGTRLKCTNSTLKYFVVVSSSFSSSTTVTLTGGSDYSLANAAITGNYISYQASPQGYPASFNWTPGYTGFSANPAATSAAKFWVVGNTVTVQYGYNGTGTSNATGFTITGLPISAASALPEFFVGFGVDNGAAVNTVQGALTTTVLTLYKDQSNGVWTNSGTKSIYNFTISYVF